MSHIQSSPRGAFGKERIEIDDQVLTGNSTALLLSGGLALGGESTDIITQNSTALLLSAGLALSGEETDVITQNSTAVAFPSGVGLKAVTTVPTTRYAPGAVVFVGNSTGNLIALNTTGTTWTYLNVTSVLA